MVTSTSIITASATTDLDLTRPETDYNDVQAAVYNILGNGSGQSGYGRAVLSAPAVVGNDVYAFRLASLKVDILKCAYHQGIAATSEIASIPTISEGEDIRAADINFFIAAASAITTNKFLLGAGQYSDENLLAPGGLPITSTRTTAWGSATKTTINHAFTVDFGSSDNARYFFNSGSSIRFSGNFDYTLNTPQNRAWDRLMAFIGTVVFNYSSTSSNGGGTGSSIGFYDLTNSPQQVFTASGSGTYVVAAYGSNNYEIRVSCDAVNNSTGGARYLYVNILFHDYHSNINSDQVVGSLTSSVAIRRASGFYVNVPPPSATNTVLLSA